MTITNNPSDVFSDMELKLMETLNERQLRQFVAAKADEYGCHGVSIVCGAYDIDRDTVYRGIQELLQVIMLRYTRFLSEFLLYCTHFPPEFLLGFAHFPHELRCKVTHFI